MALLKDDCMSGNNPKCDSGLLMNADQQEKGSHCAQLPNELLTHIASYIDGKDIVEWIGALKSFVNLGDLERLANLPSIVGHHCFMVEVVIWSVHAEKELTPCHYLSHIWRTCKHPL
jgi:hypothetical protein